MLKDEPRFDSPVLSVHVGAPILRPTRLLIAVVAIAALVLLAITIAPA